MVSPTGTRRFSPQEETTLYGRVYKLHSVGLRVNESAAPPGALGLPYWVGHRGSVSISLLPY